MKRAIRVVAVAVALMTVLPPASAQQQADPAKQSLTAKLKQKYLERREKFVGRLKEVYFAVSCKVLPGEAGARSRESYLASVREQAVLDLKEDEELVEAARQAGIDRASKPGACDYYRNHPEAAEAMRKAAADAARQ